MSLPVFYIQVLLTKKVGESVIHRTCWVEEKRIPSTGRVNIKVDGEWDGPWNVQEQYPRLRWPEAKIQEHERTWLYHRGQTDV